ncbi:methyltransferase domain-containing protein [Cellulophaga sp. Hel_I_12]|uniref:methyltransferase domain-containing protein n=1 Tax=Cellulophaga sp. Hel_I_12 TaxID=1249972 RepID=UPI000646E3EA|nr:methyltransferase domain-containing protein [Cellulophaga sp. Hel_I_12]
MLRDLSKRSYQPELMDSFDEPIASLKAVFQDINRVNQLLGGNAITINALKKILQDHPQEQYTIVDMGCGDGNMLREVAAYFRSQKIKGNFIGIDLNTNALHIAQEMSKDFPEIRYLNQDILKIDSHTFHCDILINTLTMHHFTDEQVLVFLKKFTQLARYAVVINDLQRSRLAYYLFHFFSSIFIKTKIAKIDGLISIRRAFIKKELQGYSEKIQGTTHTIAWKWAFRYVWILKPNLIKENA